MKIGNKSSIWKLITASKSLVLTTHVRPDGDGIASELALSQILRDMGKKVRIVNQDKTPEIYTWLPGAEGIEVVGTRAGKSLRGVDLAVLLDCSSMDRIGKVHDALENAKRVISIDHHEVLDCYRDGCYIDTGASSIGEMIYYFIPAIHRHLTRDIATCIYVSIMTDTGSFAYSNTTARVFRVASRLLDYGVNSDQAFRMTYYNKRVNHFRLLARVLELLKTDKSRKVAYVLLPTSVYRETGALEEDNEGILEVLRGMKEIELIILLRQLDRYQVKGSLRSLGSVNCNHLSKLFGGGGHFKASGFVVEGDVNKIGTSIVRTIIDQSKEMGWI